MNFGPVNLSYNHRVRLALSLAGPHFGRDMELQNHLLILNNSGCVPAACFGTAARPRRDPRHSPTSTGREATAVPFSFGCSGCPGRNQGGPRCVRAARNGAPQPACRRKEALNTEPNDSMAAGKYFTAPQETDLCRQRLRYGARPVGIRGDRLQSRAVLN